MGLRGYAFFVVAVCLALALPSVNAEGLRVTLNTPSITYRYSDTSQLVTGDSVPGFLEVENKNNFTVYVNLTPADNLEIDFVQLPYKMLKPNTVYTFDYNITLDRSGTWASHIIATFYTDEPGVEPDTFALTQQLTFIDIKFSRNKYLIPTVLVVIAIIIFIAFAWIYLGKPSSSNSEQNGGTKQ